MVLNMKNGCASLHSQSGSMKCVVQHSALPCSFKNSYLTTLLLGHWYEIMALYYVKSILTEISASRQDRRVLQKSKIIRIEFLSKWGMLQTSRYVQNSRNLEKTILTEISQCTAALYSDWSLQMGQMGPKMTLGTLKMNGNDFPGVQGVLRGSNSVHDLISYIYWRQSDTVYCSRKGGRQRGKGWSKSFFLENKVVVNFDFRHGAKKSSQSGHPFQSYGYL